MRKLLFGLALAALMAAGGVFAKAPEISVEDFFKKSEFTQMALSPDGKKLAALAPYKKRYNLYVIDLEKRSGTRPTAIENQDINSFVWANNERIVFTMDRDGNESFGLFAVNFDGSKGRTLVEPPENVRGVPRFAVVFKVLRDNPDEILVAANDRNLENPDIYRMNIVSGRKQILTFDNPGDVIEWVADQSGVVRVAISNPKKSLDGSIYYRDDEKAPWKKLADYKFGDQAWIPVAFDYDGKTMYVLSNIGRDKFALYEFDFAKNAPGKLIFGHDEVDVSMPIISHAKKKLIGVAYETDKPNYHWIDKDYEKLYKMVNQAAPKTFNFFSSESLDGKKLLVSSFSDVDPGRYLLLNTEKLAMEDLPDRRKWIKPDQMAPVKPVKITARDGLVLHGYLTTPLGVDAKDLPLVIHPHGGPYGARDEWVYNQDVQFLANRGFAVLQVNFRGSGGYGQKFMEAGYRQWGLKMQDDLIDAANWAIKEGIANKDRVGIYGASYGGYAAMMGVARDPDMFKWAVNYVGVTDLKEIITNPNFGDRGEVWATRVIGDVKKDEAFLKANSPTELAAKIRAPVFMAYGGEDIRVRLVNGTDMKSAMEKAGKKYEWMLKDNEGHGYRKEENSIAFYSKMDEFLKQNAK